jgi:septum site-determining protein MinD
VGEAAGWFDYVLLDVPPVAANQAVAACHAADRRALVAPGTQRGVDALPRMADRLADVDAPADLTVYNQGTDPEVDPALWVPEGGAPVACAADSEPGAFQSAVAALAETGLGVSLDVDEERAGLSRYLP